MPIPIIENEKCLPCPTAIFKIIKCRRSSEISDTKSGSGYKGVADICNPHVDPDVSAVPITDKFGKRDWVFPGDTAPKFGGPYGEGLSTSEPSGAATHGQLLIDVVVCLYDRVDPYGMAGWFKNETLTKFMKLYVVQCTSADVAMDLQRVMGKSGFESMLNNGVPKIKALEAKHISLDKQASIKKFLPIVDETTGEKIYKIEYSFTFALRNHKVDHLSYYAGCFFDMSEVIKEYNIDACTLNDSRMICKTSFINVFNNGVKENDKRIRCGRPLDIVVAPFDTEEEEEEATVQELTGRRLPYFSSLCMSRDCDNNCKFVFGIDYKRVIREKSRFGYLVTSPYVDIVNEVLRATNINDMTIFRIDNSHSADEQTFSSISSGMPEEVATAAGMTAESTAVKAPYEVVKNHKKQFPIKGKKIILSRSDLAETPVRATGMPINEILGTLDEVSLFYVSSLASPLAFRHFNIGDFQIALVQGMGIYQYGVNLQIQDNIARYLLNKVKQLRRMLARLELYYEEAIQSCNYNSYTESFFPHYIQSLHDRYPLAKRWRDPVSNIIDINKTFFFTDYPTSSELSELAQSLLYKLNPHTASPESILEVVKYIGTTLTMLHEHVGKDETDISSYFTGPGSRTEFAGTAFGLSASPGTHPALTSAETKKRNLLEIEHLFKERFDTSLLNNTGFDYLSCDGADETDVLWDETGL